MAALKEAPKGVDADIPLSDLMAEGSANQWDEARKALPDGVAPYKFTVRVHEQDQDGIEVVGHTANSSPDPRYFIRPPRSGETDWSVMSQDISAPDGVPTVVCKWPCNEGAAEYIERIREFEMTGLGLTAEALKGPMTTVAVIKEWMRTLGSRLEHVLGKAEDKEIASEIEVALQWVSTIGERVEHLRYQLSNPVTPTDKS